MILSFCLKLVVLLWIYSVFLPKGHMKVIIVAAWLRTQIWIKGVSKFYSKIGPKMGSDDSACISRKINGLLIKTAVMVGSAPNSDFTDLFGRILIVLNCKKSTILMIYSLSDPVSLFNFFVFDWSLFPIPLHQICYAGTNKEMACRTRLRITPQTQIFSNGWSIFVCHIRHKQFRFLWFIPSLGVRVRSPFMQGQWCGGRPFFLGGGAQYE